MIGEVDLYHFPYEFAQSHNLVGGWETARDHHMEKVAGVVSDEKPRVLYCGTATKRNPRDLDHAFREKGYSPHVTTVDIASYSIKNVANAVQADARCLPFGDESFDVITTDFLMNMLDFDSARRIVQEWGRVLRGDGIITTTAFLDRKESNLKELYKTFLENNAGKHFISQSTAQILFESADLVPSFTEREFPKKPLLYYSHSFTHITAEKAKTEEDQKHSRKAREILAVSQEISDITRDTHALAPRTVEEVVDDVVLGNVIIKKDDEKLVGFGRKQKANENWSEIGSVYVAPDKRGRGIGKEIVDDLISSVEGNAFFVTGNPVVSHLAQQRGFCKRKFTDLPKEVLIGLVKDRLSNSARGIHTVSAILDGGKSVWMREQR